MELDEYFCPANDNVLIFFFHSFYTLNASNKAIYIYIYILDRSSKREIESERDRKRRNVAPWISSYAHKSIYIYIVKWRGLKRHRLVRGELTRLEDDVRISLFIFYKRTYIYIRGCAAEIYVSCLSQRPKRYLSLFQNVFFRPRGVFNKTSRGVGTKIHSVSSSNSHWLCAGQRRLMAGPAPLDRRADFRLCLLLLRPGANGGDAAKEILKRASGEN